MGKTSAITKLQAIIIMIAVIVAIVIAGAAYYLLQPPTSVKSLRVGTTQPGMAGYVITGLLVDVMEDVFPNYDVSLYPIGGPTANTKEYLAGGLELSWSSASDLKLLYGRTEWYKDVPENAPMMVHTIYSLIATNPLVTTPELKSKYNLNSWKDLDGKRVTLYSAKLECYHWYMKAFEVLGIKVTHVELDFDMIPDALLKGDIVACVYGDLSGIPAPWAMSLLAKTKVVLLPPSPDEIEAIQKAGLAFTFISTDIYKNVGIDVLGLDKAFAQILVLGWNTNPKYMSEDEVYKLLRELIKRKDELAKASSYYRMFAEDPIGLQVKGISIAPEVPVHPGLARLLKEYGVWNEAWKIAE